MIMGADRGMRLSFEAQGLVGMINLRRSSFEVDDRA
jgi:hypothetical protein